MKFVHHDVFCPIIGDEHSLIPDIDVGRLVQVLI
jgi:hypothetical protein